MYLVKDKDGYYKDTSDTPNGEIKGRLSSHYPSECIGDHPCALHDTASNHPLSEAPLFWRSDKGLLERICAHGVGHPDYDSTKYLESIGKDPKDVHACDGCCVLLNPTRTCPTCKQEDLGDGEDYCINCFIKDVSVE